MTSFDEVSFPLKLARGVSGGPQRRTEIVTLGSGAEERNAVWANSKRKYDAGAAVKSHDDLHTLIVFWEARNARLRGFRLRDPVDFRSCAPAQTPSPTDQAIGTGNAATATFQLVKLYSNGGQSWTRTIKKPVAGSVRVAVAGVEKTLSTDFTVDTTTGVVTFLAGHIPGSGAAVTAGFDFDTPVRFDIDYLDASAAAFGAGQLPDIPMIEIVP